MELAHLPIYLGDALNINGKSDRVMAEHKRGSDRTRRITDRPSRLLQPNYCQWDRKPWILVDGSGMGGSA
jgi:hypothetical protein